MDGLSILYLTAILFLDTVSHLALKSASSTCARLTGTAFVLGLVRQPSLWIGIVTFALLFLTWLAFIARVPLSQGVMAGSITIVGVMIGGRIWFHERLTRMRVVAISLIALGTLLVGWDSV
jgi:drug/metabolite transporter (DMT)-like permease